MKLLMRHEGTYLLPSSEDSVEEYDKLRPGQEYSVEIKKARNPQFHRKGFKLLHELFVNQEKYTVFEDFLVEVKLVTGHYKEHITNKGKVIYVPQSLSFENMDDLEFERFYNKLLDIAVEKFGYQLVAGFL